MLLAIIKYFARGINRVLPYQAYSTKQPQPKMAVQTPAGSDRARQTLVCFIWVPSSVSKRTRLHLPTLWPSSAARPLQVLLSGGVFVQTTQTILLCHHAQGQGSCIVP